MARLLFASKRASPDIQLFVAFLFTRVKDPHEYWYYKVGRVVKYIKETIHLPLVVGADDSGKLTKNINTSFAVSWEHWCKQVSYPEGRLA